MKRMVMAVVAVLGLWNCESFGQSWCGALDADGCLWARIRIVNDSAAGADLAIYNCRTAVDSTAGTATTDFSGSWDANVAAGASEYVWVYGDVTEEDESGAVLNVVDLEVGISSADGTTFEGSFIPEDAGDGELVITVAADGSITAAVDTTGGSYSAPSRSGS